MPKYFNTTGPCHPSDHYMLPAQERCQDVIGLIERKQYFVIHAARQSGKTTLLLDVVQQLTQADDYYVLYCSLEVAHHLVEPEKGLPTIVKRLQLALRLHPRLRAFPFTSSMAESDSSIMLLETLATFCEQLDKPLVILFDEVDCLSSGTLISFLRQLRDGYINRYMMPFVHSVALVGMRNIRDYKSHIREERETLGSTSPFNIVSDALTLRNFTLAEVTRLYTQHTEQTGQVFPPEVIELACHYSQGQPWLVNAIAREIVEKILGANFTQTIMPEHVEQAVQTLILRRDTHIDSLLERLKEPRVQKIVEPFILGDGIDVNSLDDDYRYVLDLGLLSEVDKQLRPANPIYAEVMIRTLNSGSQSLMNQQNYPPHVPAYISDGRLEMRRLLEDFQTFWRENSEIWAERYQYKEAAPHLILQAFLQRILNGGGKISRELAAGRGRLDLCVYYLGHRYPLELKIRYNDKVYEKGQTQLAQYMENLGCEEGWLVVFDRRKTVSWEEKVFWQTVEMEGKTIHMVGV